MNNFHFTVASEKDFDAAEAAIIAKVEEKGFRVQHIHDVKATLAQKGFNVDALKIIELCNAKYAYQVLQKDILISLMMPCKINVYKESGQTMISALRPSMLAHFFPAAGLETVAAEVDEVIESIVNEAK